MARILIIDDESAICWALRSIAEGAGHTAEVAGTLAKGLGLLQAARPDLLILDVKLPDGDGLSLLERIRAEAAGLPVLVITAFGGLDTAVRAMQGGAIDILVKPLALDAVRAALARALGARGASEEASGSAAHAAPEPGGREPLIVGKSAPILEVFKRIGAVAGTSSPVLIQGESGTGKELVARAIHEASRRAGGPFEPIDCASLPAELVESELYGHERGAFTGALREREGRIRRAHGGTVFLDEVGELPLPAQAKLLRFLAERDVAPVGGDARVPVDVRVLAATNRPLEEAVREGRFREDLFYRLNVFTIHVPPLRERKADIPALVERFARRFGAVRVSEEAATALARHDWPGNVRELRNAVEHAAVLSRGVPIAPHHLPERVHARASPPGDLRGLVERLLDESLGEGAAPSRRVVDRVERALLEVALGRAGGSISGTARLLVMSRITVRKRLRELGLVAMPETEEGA